MKQTILSICLVFSFVGVLTAQIITVTPNPQTANFENVFLNQFNDLETHVAVTNNTNDSIFMKWERVIPEPCPTGWKTLVCDNVQCYAANTSTNYDLTLGLDKPFKLGPGETFDSMLLHVQPAMSAGCCEVLINFYLIGQPDIIETLTYNVSVNDPNCTLSSTEEPVLESLRAYPNPSTGYFSITENPLVKKVVVYNLLGRQVRSFEHINGKLYDIADTPDGMYLVSMQNANGEILKTVRITKQDLRP